MAISSFSGVMYVPASISALILATFSARISGRAETSDISRAIGEISTRSTGRLWVTTLLGFTAAILGLVTGIISLVACIGPILAISQLPLSALRTNLLERIASRCCVNRSEQASLHVAFSVLPSKSPPCLPGVVID